MTRGKMISGIGTNRKDEDLRQRGYADALAGRARQRLEPAYLVGYRGGTKRLEDDARS